MTRHLAARLPSRYCRGVIARSPSRALVVLYDGICGFCNGLVRFVAARDARRVFRFAPLQGDVAATVLARHGQTRHDLDTMYVVDGFEQPGERLLSRSTAALTLCRHLPPPWSALAVLLLLPRFIRDAGYRVFARLRYRVWGKYDSCPSAPPEWQDRFLE